MAAIFGKKVHTAFIIFTVVTGLALSFLLGACTSSGIGSKTPSPEAIGQPTDIDKDNLKPGLGIKYKEGFWRHVYQMPKTESYRESGTPGKPVLKIDHRFGNKEVFDSGRTRGVGVQMEGVIHLDKPGEWQFKARANDGIDIKIAGVQVAYDPQWHSDRFSDPLVFEAKTPGWYPILVRYFQRKGTATLEFYWKPPGAESFVIIPEKAYGHMPKSGM